MGMIFIPSAFGVTYLVKIPYGSSNGDNYDPNLIEIQKDAVRFWADSGFKLIKKEKLKGTHFFGLSFKKQIHVSEF